MAAGGAAGEGGAGTAAAGGLGSGAAAAAAAAPRAAWRLSVRCGAGLAVAVRELGPRGRRWRQTRWRLCQRRGYRRHRAAAGRACPRRQVVAGARICLAGCRLPLGRAVGNSRLFGGPFPPARRGRGGFGGRAGPAPLLPGRCWARRGCAGSSGAGLVRTGGVKSVSALEVTGTELKGREGAENPAFGFQEESSLAVRFLSLSP